MSQTFASRRRSTDKLRTPSPRGAGERSPLSPNSTARVMKAQAAALDRTPPRTASSERQAVHQAVSPQELAAGARVSAKRGAQILRLEAEAAAKRAAARELEEVRGAISKRAVSSSASPLLASPAEAAKAADDVAAAATTMAAWASNMRSRLADKDDELARLRVALTEVRAKATNNTHIGQDQASSGAQHVDKLVERLAAADQEIGQLRAALSASRQRNERMEVQWNMLRQAGSVRPEVPAATQLEIANLRQRCEAAEQMLWLTEKKAQADEEAYANTWPLALDDLAASLVAACLVAARACVRAYQCLLA